MPQIEHGKPTKYGWLVLYPEGLLLSPHTDIGAFTLIHAGAGVTIEEDVQIGSHCAIYSVSSIDNKRGGVHLEKRCKIGTHCTIMPGVTIGERAVVGAHSFVNKDVAPNTLVWGVPARKPADS